MALPALWSDHTVVEETAYLGPTVPTVASAAANAKGERVYVTLIARCAVTLQLAAFLALLGDLGDYLSHSPIP